MKRYVPGRARTVFELVGEYSRKNVAVQSLLGCLDPTFEAVTPPALGIEEHNQGRLHEQNAQVAFCRVWISCRGSYAAA